MQDKNKGAVRAFLRRRRRPLTVAAVFVALGGNVVIHDGATVLFVLILAALGCLVTWALSALTCGYLAARHSLRTRRAIVEAWRKELTR